MQGSEHDPVLIQPEGLGKFVQSSKGFRKLSFGDRFNQSFFCRKEKAIQTSFCETEDNRGDIFQNPNAGDGKIAAHCIVPLQGALLSGHYFSLSVGLIPLILCVSGQKKAISDPAL